MLGALLLNGAAFAALIYTSLWLQSIGGLSPLQAGCVFIPLSALSFGVAAFAGRALQDRPPRFVLGGGLLLIDNVIWGGSVADLADQDADTEAIRALNAKLRKDERVDLTLFAVGDGMTCALKR